MLDAGGAAHVSKAMPVKVDPAATAEVAAVNEAGCAAPRDVSLVAVAADDLCVGSHSNQRHVSWRGATSLIHCSDLGRRRRVDLHRHGLRYVRRAAGIEHEFL